MIRSFPLLRCACGPSLALGLVATAAAAMPQLGVVAGDRDPGCVASLRYADGSRWESAVGSRRLGTAEPLDAHSAFRLASLSKQFTAMAVMLLVADGRLSYDATLYDLLPGFPAWARRVTVRTLLTHTSGVPDYEEVMDAEAAAGGVRYTPEHQIQDDEVLALLQRQPALRFEPGTSWAYSNSGYVLLGLIAARVSGRPFAALLEQRIFAPLGMHDTRVLVRGGTRVKRRAYGHEPAAAGFAVADQSATSATQGDGGIYSTLADLARWDAALREHRLLPAAAMRPALEPVRLAEGRETRWPEVGDEDDLAPGQPVAYGYGWFLEPLEGHARMWHFGTTRGFRTAIMRLTDTGTTAIVLCNRTDVDARQVAERLVREAVVAQGAR